MLNSKNCNSPTLTGNCLEHFPRTCAIADSSEDPKESARSKHWTWKVWRTDHLHVNVIETGHPVSKGISALSRGIQKRKGGSCTIHFNADSSNTELLFGTIHSTNQVSIHGAVSSWCEEFDQRTPNQKESTVAKFAAKENEQLLKIVKAQEVNSLVQTPRSDNRASGKRLRECVQRLETLEKDLPFTRVCEDATFAKRVSIGMSYKTIPDVDDGFGDETPACREHTLPREDQNFRINATILWQTTIRPVLQVHILSISWHQRNWIQILSTTTKDRTSWVVICRGKNRCVEELHLNDPDHNPTSSELLVPKAIYTNNSLEPGKHVKI